MADLVGWRAIASHLGVSVRTAQRYERTLGLPVRRDLQSGRADEVRATTADIDRWLAQTATRRAEEQVPEVAAESQLNAAGATEAIATALAAGRWRSRLGWGRRDWLWAVAVIVGTAGGSAFSGYVVPPVPQVRPIVPTGSPRSNIVGDTRGQLVGRIAVDANGNGEWDAGELFAAEPGRACPHSQVIPGLVVRWEGEGRGSSSPMNCNPEPFYHGRLASGRYRVSLGVPAGWRLTSAALADVEIEPGRDTHLWFAVAQEAASSVRREGHR